MEIGEKYYIVAHAYYHYVGEVVKVIGPKTVELKNVCQIHSCKRNWTEFFAGGFASDTQFDVLPDGFTVMASIVFLPWSHSIPTKRK